MFYAIPTPNLIFLRSLLAETLTRRPCSINFRIFARSLFMQTLVTAKTLTRAAGLVLLFACLGGSARAQSTDIAWPSPVRSNEVLGKIVARDVGDARVTDHFYAFTGTPGDVLITVDSRNLNGDIDVFTFSGLRPVLKFTVYAENSTPITKSIYLRKQEDLILRVEGRTPNDDEATYRIHFGGAFEPITSGPLAEHEDATKTETATEESGRGGRRVSSTGARIEEPTVAAAPTPEPTPAESPEPTPKTARAKPTARNTRPRRPVTRRTRPVEPPKPEPTTETSAETPAEKTETEAKAPAPDAEPETKSPAPAKRPTRRGSSARGTPKPPDTQEPEDSGPRLVIETNDGTLVDRFMGTVRRVTVENGQVVVVGKDGKIQRIPLASIVRMTISP